MPSVTDRAASVAAAVAKLRSDLPAIEWRTGQMLAQLAELAEIVAELAGGAAAQQVAVGTAGLAAVAKPAEDRRKVLDQLAWMACRALPAGLDGSRRDAEICRILEGWNVTREELAVLGYAAEPIVLPVRRQHGVCGGVSRKTAVAKA
jgi:hypothetical protein